MNLLVIHHYDQPVDHRFLFPQIHYSDSDSKTSHGPGQTYMTPTTLNSPTKSGIQQNFFYQDVSQVPEIPIGLHSPSTQGFPQTHITQNIHLTTVVQQSQGEAKGQTYRNPPTNTRTQTDPKVDPTSSSKYILPEGKIVSLSLNSQSERHYPDGKFVGSSSQRHT